MIERNCYCYNDYDDSLFSYILKMNQNNKIFKHFDDDIDDSG